MPGPDLIVPHAGGTIPFLVTGSACSRHGSCPAPQRTLRLAWKPTSGGCITTSLFRRTPHAVASVLHLVGPQRLLYGSDWPALDEADVQSLIQVLGGNPLLQPDDRARIERQNALELFPRLQPGSAIHSL